MQQTPHWMAPTDESLDAGHLVGLEVDLRLVMENQLIMGDALAQVEEQRELLRGLLLLRCVDDGVPAAGPLGDVHRHVGPAQQLVGGAPVFGIHGDSHARRHVTDLAVEDEARRARLLNLPRDFSRPGEVRRLPG